MFLVVFCGAFVGFGCFPSLPLKMNGFGCASHRFSRCFLPDS